MIVLLLFGFIVGLAPLGWYFIGEWTTDPEDVVYQGAYEPLRRVEMSRSYSLDMDKALNCDPLIFRATWLYVVPLATAAFGALTGIVLGKFGFVLTRRRTREV